MKRFLAVILVLAVFGGVAMAADAAKSSADLCKNAVDPYEWVGQKTLFFKAAGKDNELSEKEFDADKAAGKGFVRSFEQWKTIVAFDKDGKKLIDWLEADAYRRDLRRRVLAAHDTSKDGKLAGEERTAANKALAAGKFATVTRSSGRGSRDSTGGSTRGSTRGQRGSPWERPETIKQYDTDKDGKLSEKEQEVARAAFRARFELQRYDANKDGKLDEKETAARDKGRAERETRRQEDEKRRKEFTERFDKNKNGRIDEDERAAVGEYFRNRDALRRFDANKDGKLDEKETAARDKDNAEREKRREETRKRFDKNGDGKLDETEERALRDYFRSQGGGRGRGGRGGGGRGGRGGGGGGPRGGGGGGPRGGGGGGEGGGGN